MANELVQQNKPKIGNNKFGLAKRIAEKDLEQSADFRLFPNRLGLVMDDSGSMARSMDKAHLAIDTFIKNCNSGDTALALYPLNAEAKSLTNILASIGIYAATIDATGGTPLYTKLLQMLEKEDITRAVAFSDGSPTDNHRSYDYESNTEEQPRDKHTETVQKYTAKKIPIDTIYIGEFGASGYITMKRIADETGGIFLHFTDASVLAKSLKYLTPLYRALLMDKETKEKVEKGIL